MRAAARRACLGSTTLIMRSEHQSSRCIVYSDLKYRCCVVLVWLVSAVAGWAHWLGGQGFNKLGDKTQQVAAGDSPMAGCCYLNGKWWLATREQGPFVAGCLLNSFILCAWSRVLGAAVCTDHHADQHGSAPPQTAAW
jgi:hypothetical protein